MKTLNRIALLAASVIAIVGCVNEMPTPQEEKTGTHTISFAVEKDIDTRTSVVEEGTTANYYWNEDDGQYFHVYENGVEALSVTMSLSSNNKIATLTATFANSNAETYSYRATYGSDLANSTPHNPLIPYNQSPRLNSFDPAADILVSAEDVVLDNNAAANQTTMFRFKLKRVVSINKMTLKGLTPGETIKTVKLSSSDGYFSSRYMINSTSSSYTGEKHWLLFDYTSLDNATVDADGNFPVYFTSAPVTGASFSVDVTTDQHVYSRDNFTSKLTLSVGTFRRFGINLEDYGEDIVAGTVYTLVESQDDFCDGASYLLVGQADKVYYAMAEQTTNNRSATVVQRNGKTITIDNTSSAHVFTIEQTTSGYTFADNDESGYLSDNGIEGSGNNKITTVTELDQNSYWTITINSDNSASIENTNNTGKPYLRFNNSQNLFACYASGQHPVYLYIDLSTAGSVKQNPELSFDEESYVFTCGDANYNDFSGQTLNNPHNLSVTWESSNTGLAIVNNGVVSFVANATGVTTISASFEGDDTYKSGSASYTITVNPASTVLTLPFIETFSNCGGTMGWSGNVAKGDFVPDYEDWLVANASGAEGAAKFGTGSKLGSAETPEINYSGNATLTFKAGAWDGNSENTNLILSLSSGTLYSDANLTNAITSVTMTKGAWTTYTVYLNVLTSPFTLTFKGNVPSNSRFFLDDVKIVEGIVVPEVEPEQLVMSDISCTNSGVNETSLNFSWSAVANATGYKVSTDGTTFGDTQSATTYTLTGLEAGTAYTIWVKAIGDGTNYTDSAAKQSASGTTKTSGDTERVVYTLTPANGSNNSYTSNCDITVDGITWNLEGNSQMQPWRMGGKSITKTDRALYSKTALEHNISKIKITHGAASNITVNSMTVIVASDANFNNKVSTLTPTFAANSTVTVKRPDGKDWSNCYYKIIYNVTVSGSSNKFLEFTKAEFYGTN